MAKFILDPMCYLSVWPGTVKTYFTHLNLKLTLDHSITCIFGAGIEILKILLGTLLCLSTFKMS